MGEKLRLQLGRVASVVEAHQLSRGPGLGAIDAFPITLVMLPVNPDGSVDLVLEVEVGDDLTHCHFQLAHLAGLYLCLVNETRGSKVQFIDLPE